MVYTESAAASKSSRLAMDFQLSVNVIKQKYCTLCVLFNFRLYDEIGDVNTISRATVDGL
jgi:hypothetical protein